MVNGRLTDEEIGATVAAMQVSEADRNILLRRIKAGDAEARFAVFFHYRRQAAGRLN